MQLGLFLEILMRKPTETVILASKLPYFEGFMESLRTYKTQESYKYALGHYARFLQEHPKLDRDGAWKEPFRKWMTDNNLAQSSIPVHLSAVKKYLKYRDEQREVSETRKWEDE